jgi:ubiquinone/menaquinone biosynthesis C-methylase UbiE
MTLELCEPLVHPGARWLDAGCGTGHLMRQLHRRGAYVMGADSDERMLAFTRQYSSDFVTPVVAAYAEALPYGDASMDGVVATSLAGCLPLLGPFLAETYRVLREGGHALITFTNRSSLLLKLNHLGAARTIGERYQLYTTREVVREFENIGFRIEKVIFYNFVLHRGNGLFPPGAIARRSDALFHRPLGPWLARNFVVVAAR